MRGQHLPRRSLLKRGENCLDYPVYSLENFGIGEADDPVACLRQKGGAFVVVRNFAISDMCRSIEFNDKLFFAATEIGEIGTERRLPNEFEALQFAPAKPAPQLPFRSGLLAAQFAGSPGLMKTQAAHGCFSRP